MTDQEARMALPICCVTGRIAGDPNACGDCDPCSAAYKVPDPVKRLIKERDEWREKYSDVMCRLDAVAGEPGAMREALERARPYVKLSHPGDVQADADLRAVDAALASAPQPAAGGHARL